MTNQTETNFIHFENNVVGTHKKYIKVKMSIDKIAKYLREVDGELILEFNISRRNRPVKGAHYIAWTTTPAKLKQKVYLEYLDNSKVIESIL